VILILTNESFNNFPPSRGLGVEAGFVVVGSAVSVSVVEKVNGNDGVVVSSASRVVGSDGRVSLVAPQSLV